MPRATAGALGRSRIEPPTTREGAEEGYTWSEKLGEDERLEG